MRWILLIVAAALAGALAQGLLDPRARALLAGAPAPGEITMAAARAAGPAALWVDARAATDFARGHVPGALPLNEEAWEDLVAPVLLAWQPGRLVIVYCDEAGCQASARVAQRLREVYGIEPVRVLQGGWQAWLREEAR